MSMVISGVCAVAIQAVTRTKLNNHHEPLHKPSWLCITIIPSRVAGWIFCAHPTCATGENPERDSPVRAPVWLAGRLSALSQSSGKRPLYLVTVSFTALFSVPEGAVTVTYPLVAPAGIVAVM